MSALQDGERSCRRLDEIAIARPRKLIEAIALMGWVVRSPYTVNIKMNIVSRNALNLRVIALTVMTFEFEHIRPLSAGGETVFENLCFACTFCNRYEDESRINAEIFACFTSLGKLSSMTRDNSLILMKASTS